MADRRRSDYENRGRARRPESSNYERTRNYAGDVVPRGVGRGATRCDYQPNNAVVASRGIDNQEFYANYFELESRPDFTLYQYHVEFVPAVENPRFAAALVNQHEKHFAKMVLAREALYTITKLPKPVTEMVAQAKDGSLITVRYKFTGELQKHDTAYTQFMNSIVRFCLRKLNLVMMDRNYYDPHDQVKTSHNLSIWPGYVTTIHCHDKGYLLNVEIRHKIVRQDTALGAMKTIYQENRDRFAELVKSELLGKVVMTLYNHKTYRIDDVAFDKNPDSTFHLKKEDREISFVDYFAQRWNTKITDKRQPLLVVRPSRRDINRGDTSVSYLVPELCLMTGLSDQHLSNFRVKNDIAAVTRLDPQARVQSLMRFRHRLASTPAIVAELDQWGLRFKDDIVRCQAQLINPVKITLGDNEFPPRSTGWSNQMQRCHLASNPGPLDKWAIVYPPSVERDVRNFCCTLKSVSDGLNIKVAEPLYFPTNTRSAASSRSKYGDSTTTVEYLYVIREICSMDDSLQMIVCVLKSKRADHYQAIKQMTLCDRGILSQVITLGNMTDDKKKMSVATKLMLQIATKLGAEPWKVITPAVGWMVAGFDTYHDARQSRGVGAFVASLNDSFSRYYSKSTKHENNEELAPNFRQYAIGALKAYYTENKKLPSKVIVYRDGVGAGCVQRVLDKEALECQQAIEDARKIVNCPYDVGLSFVIVSKRINTRVFAKEGTGFTNPPAGLVVNNTVTLPDRHDFFLVSQNVNRGTVSPTSYNVIYNTAGISMDIHQRLAYYLTHMYFNWAGTLSIPAPVQYAHKLAYLVGESLNCKTEPKEHLSKLLYFL